MNLINFEKINSEISSKDQEIIKNKAQGFQEEAIDKFEAWCSISGYEIVDKTIVKKEKINSFKWKFTQENIKSFDGKNLKILEDGNIYFANEISQLEIFTIKDGSIIEVSETPFERTTWKVNRNSK